MSRRKWSRWRCSSEEGTTLTELAATIAIMSLVMATAFTAMISLQNAGQGANERTQNLSEARLLMERTTRDLRTAVRLASATSPFVTAMGNDVTFYANLSTSGPTRVRFSVNAASRLVEDVTEFDSGSAPNYTFTGIPKTRMVGEYIVNPATSPPFEYYDDAGLQLVMDPACSCLSAADLLKIDAVGIRFSVRRSTSLQVAPTTLSNRVRLPNVDYNPLPTP